MIGLSLEPTCVVAGARAPLVMRLHNTGPGLCSKVRVDLRASDHMAVLRGRRFAVPALAAGRVHDHPVVVSCAIPGRHVLRVHRLEYVGPDGRLRREQDELVVDVDPAPPPSVAPPRPTRRGSIVVSYWIADSDGPVSVLVPALESAFPDRVFHDRRTLRGGDDWQARIEREVAAAAVVIVVISTRWLTLTDEYGRVRIEDEDDVVRREVTLALEKEPVVVPVLVGGAPPLRPQQLPVPLRPLCRRQFHRMTSDQHGIDSLVAHVRRVLGE